EAGLSDSTRRLICTVCRADATSWVRSNVEAAVKRPTIKRVGLAPDANGVAGLVAVVARRPPWATTPCESCRLSEDHSLGGHCFGRKCCPDRGRCSCGLASGR